MKVLLISDIHGNYPALTAIESYFSETRFNHIINCGDSLVYAPFPNEVLKWLRKNGAITILGNTDKKVIKLIHGRSFIKPSKPEKRIMYTSTAEQLTTKNRKHLLSFNIKEELRFNEDAPHPYKINNLLGIFHGSPAKPHEFLFATSPVDRFNELASEFPYNIIVTGHSHTPFHITVNGTHFVNPGSVGRMFDGNPAASCAVLDVSRDNLYIHHYRIPYDVRSVIDELKRQKLPEVYQTMFLIGKKLN